MRQPLKIYLRSSASGSYDRFPIGTILPYVGDIKDIPKKWALCDGSNGTPDLTGRFLEGVKTKRSASITKEAALPNIRAWYEHFWTGLSSPTQPGTVTGGANLITFDTVKQLTLNSGPNKIWLASISFDASRYNSIYNQHCYTVQPASYTVMYIIKIKK